MMRGPIVEAVRTIVRDLFPRVEFAGDYEYRVESQAGAHVDLRPVNGALQLPALRKVPFRGAPGVAATLAAGARVLVRFVDSDPGRPYVAAVVGEDDTGHVPVTLRIVAIDSITLEADDTITLGDSGTNVNAAGAYSSVLRTGEAVQLVATGNVVAGVGSGAIDVKGILTINPLIEVAEGAPGTGFSRVRA